MHTGITKHREISKPSSVRQLGVSLRGEIPLMLSLLLRRLFPRERDINQLESCEIDWKLLGGKDCKVFAGHLHVIMALSRTSHCHINSNTAILSTSRSVRGRPERTVVDAAVLHWLRYRSQGGHCFSKRRELVLAKHTRSTTTSVQTLVHGALKAARISLSLYHTK